MFIEECGDELDEFSDVICSYAAFCRERIIPRKGVQIYTNNKPWGTKSVRSSLQAEKLAFKNGAASELHPATKEVKTEVLKAKNRTIK